MSRPSMRRSSPFFSLSTGRSSARGEHLVVLAAAVADEEPHVVLGRVRELDVADRVVRRVGVGDALQLCEVQKVVRPVDHVVGRVVALGELDVGERLALRVLGRAAVLVVVDVRQEDRAVRRVPGVFVLVLGRIVEVHAAVAVHVGAQIDDRLRAAAGPSSAASAAGRGLVAGAAGARKQCGADQGERTGAGNERTRADWRADKRPGSVVFEIVTPKHWAGLVSRRRTDPTPMRHRSSRPV